MLNGAGVAQLRRGLVIVAVDGIGVGDVEEVDEPHGIVEDALTEARIGTATHWIGQCRVGARFVGVEEAVTVEVAAEESASAAASALAVVRRVAAAAGAR